MDILFLNIENVNQMIEDGIVLPNYFINNEMFINKYIDVVNIETRRYYINKLMENNYSLYERINNIVLNEYDEIFDNKFEDYINSFKQLFKIPNSEETIKKICSHNLYQMLIDRYFEDFEFNIVTNIKNMLEFNEKVNCKIISNDKVNIYNLILNFEKCDFEEERKIYNSIPNNIKELLYEDFRNCQNYAYSLINKNIIDVSKLNNEEINGIKIYYLNGEDFILPVHCILSNLKKEDITWNEYSSVKTSSLSLIGTECLGLFADPKCGVVGFNHLNVNDIMHIYHTDSYSHKEKSTDKVNELFMPHDLLIKTFGYNELLIAQNITNNERLIPNYVICYDELDESYFKFSTNLGNIPIIVINTKIYKENNRYYKQKYIDYDEKIYKKILKK